MGIAFNSAYVHGVRMLVTCVQCIPRNFFAGGGVQQIQLRTGQRERRSGGGRPQVRVQRNLQMSKTCILIRLL
jgi:hypothetical protein